MSEEKFVMGLDDPAAIKAKKEVLKDPIKPVKITSEMTVADLVESYAGMSIQARNLGGCADVLRRCYQDKDRPTVLLGIAGPLIAAGLRRVIRDMVVEGLVDVVVSTGAILYQDIYQARGFKHYVGTPEADDTKLRDLYIDRIYDTYVDEEKFWETDVWLGNFAGTLPAGPMSSRQYMEAVGKTLNDEESIVYQCAKLGVPIFVPAINDSSIGIGLTHHYHQCKKNGKEPLIISSIQDNYELTQIVVNSPTTAAIYVAGGVPKNYINDSVVMAYIFETDTGGHRYAIQVTTDSPHWGGLSGSTLAEAQSWGKVNKEANKQMAFVEPSVSLPLLVGTTLQRGWTKGRSRLSFSWEKDILKSIKTK